MTGFTDAYDRSLRLALLRLLEEAPGYSANTAVLHSAVKSMAFHVSRDKIETTIDWLAEQGLVKKETMGPVNVAIISARGIDVAQGTAQVTGVDRPSPKG